MEPGFFRTALLEKESTAYAERSIDDYAERTAQTRPAWEAMSGKQGGDPAKLAKALVTVVDQDRPPLRWVAGADAVETVEKKANELLAQVDAYRSPEERKVFEDWMLTAQTYAMPRDWEKILAEAGYTGDYYWTILEIDPDWTT